MNWRHARGGRTRAALAAAHRLDRAIQTRGPQRLSWFLVRPAVVLILLRDYSGRVGPLQPRPKNRSSFQACADAGTRGTATTKGHLEPRGTRRVASGSPHLVGARMPRPGYTAGLRSYGIGPGQRFVNVEAEANIQVRALPQNRVGWCRLSGWASRSTAPESAHCCPIRRTAIRRRETRIFLAPSCGAAKHGVVDWLIDTYAVPQFRCRKSSGSA